jgi:isopenicillin N synthase-like dioxygenase
MAPPTLVPISLALQDRDPIAFAAEMGRSFARHGFAVVADPGLDRGKIADALGAAKAFFALPDDAKRRYAVPGGLGQRGYTPFGVETAKGSAASDLKEFWHVGRDLPHGHPLEAFMPANIWPDAPARFRSDVTWLFEALDELGDRLLGAVALYLGLSQDAFRGAVADGNSVLRLLHYPPTRGGGPAIRAGAHADINAITLLLGAEEAGLEILDRDGTWRAVDPPAGAVVVNIGDMLSRLTNDFLPSTTHRVVNPAPDRQGVARYSMPFFLHFRPDFLIETLSSCVSPDRPNRYPHPITANEFLRQRLKEIKLT